MKPNTGHWHLTILPAPKAPKICLEQAIIASTLNGANRNEHVSQWSGFMWTSVKIKNRWMFFLFICVACAMYNRKLELAVQIRPNDYQANAFFKWFTGILQLSGTFSKRWHIYIERSERPLLDMTGTVSLLPSLNGSPETCNENGLPWQLQIVKVQPLECDPIHYTDMFNCVKPALVLVKKTHAWKHGMKQNTGFFFSCRVNIFNPELMNFAVCPGELCLLNKT